ncbi:MAG: class I SAM-dependent methyltransferase [Candidatus Altiarchaeota archaeon]|nr:class I SAM-dependent methyltransferase [Candidatus Altiarchaeota archaeon]
MNEREYSDMYDVEEKHWWFQGRKTIYLSILNKIFKTYEKRKILDFGCGTGYNMLVLQRVGQVEGVDISEHSKLSCEKQGLEVRLLDICGDDNNVSKLSDRYDLITAFDVLEHIDDDLTVISRLRSMLKEGGYLLITVPAFNFLWTNHDNILHHKRRYTKKELQDKLEKNGFKVVVLSYYNLFLFPFALLRRIINPRRSSTKMMYIPLLNHVMWLFYTLESRLVTLNIIPFGVSLICLVRK